MSFGPSYAGMHRRAADYAANPQGAEPSEPARGATHKSDFIINLKTAKALGLTIPLSLLLRADQVIDDHHHPRPRVPLACTAWIPSS